MIPVCIFAKPPLPGRVKTRTARVLGDQRAAQLASAMLCDVWSVVQSATGVIPVLAAAEPGPFPIDVPSERIWLQAPGDLGWRIESILRRGLQSAPAAIALGADSPLLTPTHLQQALESLATDDAVLGPSEDGGFYLLGMHHCPPGVLADLPWSSEETCARTEQRLRSHGMSVATIPSLSDVDTVADLEQLRGQLAVASPDIAPQTRSWLSETSWSAS